MSLSYEDLEETARSLVRQGTSNEDLIFQLHEHGASILDSIKALRNVRGISLGLAKEIVSSHPVWEQIVTASQPLHDEAVAAAEEAAREETSQRRCLGPTS